MKELKRIQAELKAPKGQFNGFGKYKYRSCEDILEAVKCLLNDHDCILLLSDEIINVGDRNYVKATATLINNDGSKISVSSSACEAATKKGMDPAQITGAASSYARKYALNGLFAIDDNKDADTTTYQPQPLAQPSFITPQQAGELRSAATGKDHAKIVEMLKHYGAAKFDGVKASDYPAVKTAMGIA